MCVNPETKRPYSSSVIEKALKDNGFSYISKDSAKKNVKIIKKIIKINYLILLGVKSYS